MIVDLHADDQAAEFSAELTAQRAVWAALEWWTFRGVTHLVAVTRGDEATNNLRQVGVIWSKQ